MDKRIHLKSLLLIVLFIGLSACHAQQLKKRDVKAVPAFVGGLNSKNIHTCAKRIKNQCHEAESPMDSRFTDCIETQMVQESSCSQNLSLFILERGFFEKIRHYNKVDVARVSVIAANEPVRYFMISYQGELIDPLRLVNRIDITRNRHYDSMAKDFPRIELWGIVLGFPKSQQLSDHRTRLIFQQKLLNGCHACEQAGIAEIAYDFDKEGRFLNTTLLKLIPISQQ
jgi:hypothetical protein